MHGRRGERLTRYQARCGLCGGKKFDFDPAGFAAVKEFVGIDRGGERLEIGQHRERIDDIGSNHIVVELLDDDAFMTENSSFLHTRHGTTHEMQIGAADSVGGQTHNGIEIVLYRWLLDVVQSNVSNPMNDCFYAYSPEKSFWRFVVPRGFGACYTTIATAWAAFLIFALAAFLCFAVAMAPLDFGE